MPPREERAVALARKYTTDIGEGLDQFQQLFKQQQQQQQEQAKHAAAEKQGETGAADAALSHHSQMPSVMRRGVASRSLSVSCVSAQPFFLEVKKTERERLHLPMWQARSHSSCQGR